jgi:hypothetical protein
MEKEVEEKTNAYVANANFMAKDIRSKFEALLKAMNISEQEFETMLQDPQVYPIEAKELINEYRTDLDLTVQRALDESRASHLKKEENRGQMSHWIHVK